MTHWMPKGIFAERSTSRAADHAIRERRLEEIRDVVEQFAFSLALLIAGHDPPNTTASDEAIAKLHNEMRPFLSGRRCHAP